MNYNTLFELMDLQGLDGVFLSNRENPNSAINVTYATGFKGSFGFVLITKEKKLFFTDFRYRMIAKEQVSSDYQIIELSKNHSVSSTIEELGIKKLGFDKTISYAEYESFAKMFTCELIPMDNIFEKLRMVKTEEELVIMREAARISDLAFEAILDFIKPGVTEIAIADELERVMKLNGGDGHSFSPIVASGARGALPHGRATDKVIQEGELITMDFGCYYQGYASDMTRTVAVGQVDKKLLEIYDIVLESQIAGVEAVKVGIKGQDVDKVCRDIIDSKGYGSNFGHGTGHGLGMLVHEGPSVGSKSNDILAPGNVITVEPGIYIDGFGGVRIEDDVVVKADGIEVLTKSPKELIIL